MTRAQSDSVSAAPVVAEQIRPAPTVSSAPPAADGASAPPFWSLDRAAAHARLRSTRQGLSTADAQARAESQRGIRLGATGRTGSLRLLAGQFTSPISLLLVAAAVILASGLLGLGSSTALRARSPSCCRW